MGFFGFDEKRVERQTQWACRDRAAGEWGKWLAELLASPVSPLRLGPGMQAPGRCAVPAMIVARCPALPPSTQLCL